MDRVGRAELRAPRRVMMSHSERLLIVDDNPVVLLGFSELLRSAGYNVLEARNAAEAFQLARQHRPDLILLDVVLPDESGVHLCRRLKSDPALASLFVVLVSSTQTAPGSQATGLEAGADGYIARPIENRELLARVESLLRIQQAEAAVRRSHDELEDRVEERTAELAHANARLRAMSLRLVEVQESERRLIARELHDQVGQTLTGLKMELDQSLPLATGPLRERLNDAVELVNDLVTQVRQLSLELRPHILHDLGLVVALEWHFQRYTRQTNVQVRFLRTELPQRPSPTLESAVFRIVQEALTNVARHAQVREVVVRLWIDAERIGVQIEDKGVGFDAGAALASRDSSGLAGIRERAELLGGEFTLESSPGKGVRLTVELPLRAAAGAFENGEVNA